MSLKNRQSNKPVAPKLMQLETREVPAVFYVDPTLAGSNNGDVLTFNAGQPNQVTNLVYGKDGSQANATLFSSLSLALEFAAANPGSDDVILANGTINADNSGGGAAAYIDHDVNIIGSGKFVTTIKPTADATSLTPDLYDSEVGLFEISGGATVSFQNLGFDAAGWQLGIGIYAEDTKLTIINSSFANVFYDNIGSVIYGNAGSEVVISGSDFAQYGSDAVSIFDSNLTVTNSVFMGLGATPPDDGFVTYGLNIAGGSFLTAEGNTFANHRSVASDDSRSAAIFLWQDGLAPNATINNNGFVNNEWGVLVGFQRGADNSVATLRNNFFEITNDVGVVARNNVGVDAKMNYWGAPNGPFDGLRGDPVTADTKNPYGQGVMVDSFVDYSFFYRVPPSLAKIDEFAIAQADGSFTAQLTSQANGFAPRLQVTPFGGAFAGPINTAAGDINGDGINELVVVAGQGGGPRLQVFDGATGSLLHDFFVFDPAFSGGVNVAVGDVNGDGYGDILVTPATNGGPSVRIFSGKDFSILLDVYAFEGPVFTGGISIATGDLDNDGYSDIIVGAGANGNGRVQALSSRHLLAGKTDIATLADFSAFSPLDGAAIYTPGVFVAAGDLTGDGRADIAVAAGAGGGGYYRAWASQVDGFKGAAIADGIASDFPIGNGAVRVTAHDINGDLRKDLVFSFTGVEGVNKLRSNYAGALFDPLETIGGGLALPGTNGAIVG